MVSAKTQAVTHSFYTHRVGTQHTLEGHVGCRSNIWIPDLPHAAAEQAARLGLPT